MLRGQRTSRVGRGAGRALEGGGGPGQGKGTARESGGLCPQLRELGAHGSQKQEDQEAE